MGDTESLEGTAHYTVIYIGTAGFSCGSSIRDHLRLLMSTLGVKYPLKFNVVLVSLKVLLD